jgi:stage III sporulation protein AB
MALRLFAAAALSVACALAGRAVAGACVRRASTLGELIDSVRRLEVNMLDKLMPLREALQCGHEAMRAVADAMQGCGASGAWHRAKEALLMRGGALDCLACEDVEALCTLFEGLGTSGAAQQRLLIGGAIESLQALKGEADKKAREESKLYSTLGLLAGMSLAILLM